MDFKLFIGPDEPCKLSMDLFKTGGGNMNGQGLKMVYKLGQYTNLDNVTMPKPSV